MIDLIYLALLLHNISNDEYKFNLVDAYIESQTNYTYYYWARPQLAYLNDSKGDCTDKALLKCAILRKEGIPCGAVTGYKHNIQRPENKHAWILARINDTWISSEPKLKPLWAGAQ